MGALRVMVVDDSAVFRQAMSRVLATIPDVEVVTTAANGQVALQRLKALSVDVMTLDVEMPGLDGLGTLVELAKIDPPPCEVIMVSATTTDGAETTLRALELGAYDFVSKPSGASQALNEQTLRAPLVPIVTALKARRTGRGGLVQRPLLRHEPPAALVRPTGPLALRGCGEPAAHRHPVDVVAIGISTGGPAALAQMVPMFPAGFPVPILLVQHMPPGFTATLAQSLGRKSDIKVVEAEDGITPRSGTLYIAPGGKQMRVVKRGRVEVLELTDDPPEHNCRPSVDHLFRSVAELHGPRAVGVIMTGMGADGVAGMRQMRDAGAFTVAQDAATSTVHGMPGEAIKAGVVQEVLPLDKIACRLTLLARARGAA